MSPDSVQAMIDRLGETTILRRQGQSDLSVKAKVRFFSPAELVGGIIQGDRRAAIGNAEIAAAGWPGPPKKGDFLVIDGAARAVQACNSVKIGDDYAMHVLQVRG